MPNQHPRYRQSFPATPIKVGEVYSAKQRRSRIRQRLRTAAWCSAVLLGVFGGGMLVANWSAVRAAIGADGVGDVSFSECGMVRRNCVVDGDTFWMHSHKIRIADIDTPEISKPGCPSEYEREMRAKHRLQELLNAGPIELATIPGRDKDQYGRDLRIVLRDGRSLGDQLVSEGHARTWTGRRERWC